MIRNVTPDDGAAISAIYNHYVEQSDISFEEVAVTPQEMAARITSISDRYPGVVFCEGEQLLGYAYASAWKSRAALATASKPLFIWLPVPGGAIWAPSCIANCYPD